MIIKKNFVNWNYLTIFLYPIDNFSGKTPTIRLHIISVYHSETQMFILFEIIPTLRAMIMIKNNSSFTDTKNKLLKKESEVQHAWSPHDLCPVNF